MKRFLSILVLVSALAVVLWATTTGPNTPGAFDDVNQWTSVISDYQTDDDTYADTVDCFDAQIDELDTFGFAITNGDDIDGITVVLRAKRDSGAARSRQIAVRLIKAGSPTGETKNTPNITTGEVGYTLGGAADKWTTTWTESEVENAGFGVELVGSASQSTSSCLIDIVTITIDHSTPSSGAKRKRTIIAKSQTRTGMVVR